MYECPICGLVSAGPLSCPACGSDAKSPEEALANDPPETTPSSKPLDLPFGLQGEAPPVPSDLPFGLEEVPRKDSAAPLALGLEAIPEPPSPSPLAFGLEHIPGESEE